MQAKTLTLYIDGAPVELTVTGATVAQGMRRSRLRVEAQNAGETDPDRALLRLFTFPDLVAATTAAAGIPWPLSFDQFLELPDALVGPWEQAVYALNPHWLPGGGPPPDPKA